MGWAVDPNVINYNGDIWRTDVPVNKRYITTAQGAGGSLNHQSLILPNFLPSFANTNIHFVPIRSTNDGEIFGNDFSSSGVPQGQLQVGGFRFKFVLANDWRHTGVWFPVAAGSYQSNEIVTVSRNIYWHQATGEVLCFQSGSFKYSLNAGTNCWRTPAGVFTPTLNPFHACWFNWIFTASNQIPADLGGIYASVTSSHYSSNSPYAPLTTTNRFYPRWSDLSWYIATRHWTIWNANGFRQVLLP